MSFSGSNIFSLQFGIQYGYSVHSMNHVTYYIVSSKFLILLCCCCSQNDGNLWSIIYIWTNSLEIKFQGNYLLICFTCLSV